MAFLPAGYAEIHRTAPNRPLHAVRFSPRRIPYRRSIRRIRRARRHPRTPRASDAHTHTHRNSGKTTLTVSHGTTEARTGLPARSRPFHRQSTPIRPILCSTNPTAQNASCTPRAGRGLALKHEKFLCPGPVKRRRQPPPPGTLHSSSRSQSIPANARKRTLLPPACHAHCRRSVPTCRAPGHRSARTPWDQ